MKTKLFLFSTFLFTLMAGGAFITSCTKEFDTPALSDEDSEVLTIRFDQSHTKTLNDGNSTVWAEGDALSVFHSTVGGTTFWPSWFGFYGANMFQGTVWRLSSTNDWYAVYPYQEDNVAADQVRLTFPSRQTQTGNDNKAHFSGEQFPMFGKKTGIARDVELSMEMHNLLAAAQFKITNTTDSPIVVKEVELTADTYIAGGFKVDLTAEEPVLTAEKSLAKSVILSVNEGEAFDSGETALFYLAVVPFVIPAGGELKVKVVAEHPSNPGANIFFYHTFTLENGATFTSGLVKTVNVSFDEGHGQNPDAGSAGEVDLEPGEQPEDGSYLLVYEDGENSMAFAAFAEYKDQKYAVPVEVVDGNVLPQEGLDLSRFAMTIEVALDENGNPIEHSNDEGHYAYNVRNADGQFVFYSTGGGNLDASEALQIRDINEMDIDGTTYKYYHTFVQEEDGVQILSSISGASGGNKYLLAYTPANGFYYEQDNTGQKLHLYLLGGSAKEKQNLSFSTEEVAYDFDGLGEGVLPNPPVLYGAMTHVTYSSSNESVATVDETSGVVTVHKAGSATITATAEADAQFYAGTAHYRIVSSSSLGTTFYLVTELTAGEQYLVVSGGKALTNNQGSIGATDVTAVDGEILVADASSVTWTAAASSSGFTLVNNGYYVQRGSSQNGKPSISNNPNSSYYVWTYDGSRLYTGSSSSYYSSTYYLYYNSGWTQTSSASSAGAVALYSSTKPLTPQNLSFDYTTIRWIVGEGGDHELNQSYAFPQTVKNAMTTVTYESSAPSVATISGNMITVKSIGSTTITATAQEENGYKKATASYTLRITNPAPDGFVDLGVFNLENDDVRQYLDAAETSYTDDNYKTETGGAGVSIVSTYTKDYRTRRMDFPAPVTIDWGSGSSGTTTITIFADQALEQEVWVQTATNGSTSSDVYNLIPGRTYYCTVEDNTGYLLKGIFATEGRRRMMLVSTKQNQNNANNCRDLGGLKTTDGRRIKYGMIYRGTNLDGTKGQSIDNYLAPNNTEQGYLMNFMNVGYDIDLRAGGNSALPVNQVQYIEGEMDASLSSVTDTRNATVTLQGFFDAAAAGKASYFHCAIGSDRTGFWGLLIEGLLGVSVKDCSIDFELTGFAGGVTGGDRPRNNTGYLFFQGMENKSGNFKGFSNYDGDTFQQKVAVYVRSLGFTDAQIEAFRNAVLEPDE